MQRLTPHNLEQLPHKLGMIMSFIFLMIVSER
jgi:hypothetical protein